MEIADYIIADDRVLVELVLQGDNIAFEYLFERYKEAIHRLFIQRTNNPLDADDLLQETFTVRPKHLLFLSTFSICF